MLERLTMTQNEEEDRILYIRKANQKRKEALARCEKVRKELQNAKEQRDLEANKRAETIRQLKSDLHQIEQFAEESARRIKSEIEKVYYYYSNCHYYYHYYSNNNRTFETASRNRRNCPMRSSRSKPTCKS